MYIEDVSRETFTILKVSYFIKIPISFYDISNLQHKDFFRIEGLLNGEFFQ